jgi:hypothetical protein
LHFVVQNFTVIAPQEKKKKRAASIAAPLLVDTDYRRTVAPE